MYLWMIAAFIAYFVKGLCGFANTLVFTTILSFGASNASISPVDLLLGYGEIARIIANERGIGHMSSQAVGGAVGKNPISLIIPCHRVIGSDGSLTGYGGGLERKAALLKLERRLD